MKCKRLAFQVHARQGRQAERDCTTIQMSGPHLDAILGEQRGARQAANAAADDNDLCLDFLIATGLPLPLFMGTP